MKTKQKKRNPSFESGETSFRSRGTDLILTDINLLISELEDLKSNIRTSNLKELRGSFKNISNMSDKILNKLVKRINDETGIG